jgi:hypothetical protein
VLDERETKVICFKKLNENSNFENGMTFFIFQRD